jgi:ATPase subunit of ABC transporter with duplicated ATPase domains
VSTLSLRAERASFSYGERVLLDDVSFHLTRGWTGLVGANGSGKSTLLRLIKGELAPTSGALRVEPTGDATTVLCPQEVESLDAAVRALAEAEDGAARQLLGRLALEPATLERWDTLSPGERKRWQLGAALWPSPDVLLLDEPSNHLDAEAASLLRSALASFRGVGVLVSHDRALLDAVTTSTLRLDRGEARLWAAPYSAARALWEDEARRGREAQRASRRRLENEEARLDAARRRLASSSSARSTGARMKDARDSDARTLGANFRAEMAERAHAASLRRSLGRSEALREELAGLEVRDDAGRDLFLRYEPCPRAQVLRYAGDVFLPRGGRRLLREVALVVRRDEHVVVEGKNGAGKSTLLGALLEAAALPPERVLVLPQELSAEALREDLETVRALPKETRGRVLQLVHALGVEPDALLASARLSPGEGRKLRLALGLGRHAWLAVLDEPTNHFDLPAIERLEEALAALPGALVMVTHDARLAARVAQTRWRVDEGVVQTMGVEDG